PGAALLVSLERVPLEAFEQSYAERASTSQSLLIAQSVDASQRCLARHGDQCFRKVMWTCSRLERQLLRGAGGIRFLHRSRPGPHDPTKLTVSLDAYATTG